MYRLEKQIDKKKARSATEIYKTLKYNSPHENKKSIKSILS